MRLQESTIRGFYQNEQNLAILISYNNKKGFYYFNLGKHKVLYTDIISYPLKEKFRYYL